MQVKQAVNHRLFKLLIVGLLFSYAAGNARTSSAAVYLDGSSSGCSNGSANYNPSSRTCGSGSDKVYTDLSTYAANITAGAVNYIRAGNYYYTTSSKMGSLDIPQAKSGTSASPTIIKAYPGEERQAVIATASNKFQYNPNPKDTSGANSAAYYPNSAVTIRGSYIIVDGIKTYGQVVIHDTIGGSTIHDSSILNSDIGGGGPYINQGPVVFIASAYNISIRNNKIHNSCWGESPANGSALMGYDFAALIENNEFYDNLYADIRVKDTTNRGADTIEIRFNFFRNSTIDSAAYGIRSIGNAAPGDNALAGFLIHNNVFYKKGAGVSLKMTPTCTTNIYNNTFIDNSKDITNDDDNVTVSNVRIYNNIFYHTNSGAYYFYLWGLANNKFDSNDNVFYSTAASYKWLSSSANTTALTTWKASGKDATSISSNPNFVSASGSTPESFKRSSYAENFTDSPYSTRSGAYVTGNEVVGYSSGSNPSPSGSLLAPQNLMVKQLTP